MDIYLKLHYIQLNYVLSSQVHAVLHLDFHWLSLKNNEHALCNVFFVLLLNVTEIFTVKYCHLFLCKNNLVKSNMRLIYVVILIIVNFIIKSTGDKEVL